MKIFINKLSVFCIVSSSIIYLRLYLSFFGFGKLIHLLKKPRNNFLRMENLSYVSKSISLASTFLPNITCLIRAAVLKFFFNEIEDLKVIIGINRNEDNMFESHAWVTRGDIVIMNNDPKINSYKVIYKI